LAARIAQLPFGRINTWVWSALATLAPASKHTTVAPNTSIRLIEPSPQDE
jgi:hypothetical protein